MYYYYKGEHVARFPRKETGEKLRTKKSLMPVKHKQVKIYQDSSIIKVYAHRRSDRWGINEER